MESSGTKGVFSGGTLLTMSYFGSEKVVPNYGIMGPVKAALECCVRYLAYDLGPKKIRVHAISPTCIDVRSSRTSLVLGSGTE